MSVVHELDLQLGRIDQASLPHEAILSVEGGELRCSIAGLDAIGCAVEYVRLVLDDQTRWTLDSMRALADHLCKQLRYLVEPLQVIEVDSDEPLVQARSLPPSRDAQQSVNYYELLVSPQSLSLVRFSAPRGAERHTVPMQLTREILGRLLQDIADAL